ncbi:MAG: hypothetical protein KAQ89_05075 [Planctomycetes bacterium]|nr:hypothetical protein [Planctomycetota bacterium]
MRKYSDFFKTLHDEQSPTGYLGRGTHYSVLRGITWHDCQCLPLQEAQFHDFSIIWDEDHDDRVIPVIEHLFIKGLLPPIVFVGERKGQMTIITQQEMPQWYHEKCCNEITFITHLESDEWQSEIVYFSSSFGGIIADSEKDVGIYLANIKMLWQLGHKSCH